MEVKEVKGVSSLCSHQGKLKDNSFAVRFKAENIYGDKVTKKRAKSKAKRHFFSPSTAARGIVKRPMGHSPSPHRAFEVLSVGISTRT